MIVDKLHILFKSGDGGRGSASVKKISPLKSVPAGGDGGKGGDIILRASSHLYDLSKLKGKRKITAPAGEPGLRRRKSGKDAEPVYVDLPLGSRILDENNSLIVSLTHSGQEYKLCRGGAGGKGSFRNPATTAPARGQSRLVVIDYRIPADIAVIGFANSGKTTLFNLLTGQKNKVAAYPFTTASCALGHVVFAYSKASILDTPPLRKTKAASSKNRFLRHSEKCKVILIPGSKDDFARLREELDRFCPGFLTGKKAFYLRENIDKINTNNLKKRIFAYLGNFR